MEGACHWSKIFIFVFLANYNLLTIFYHQPDSTSEDEDISEAPSIDTVRIQLICLLIQHLCIFLAGLWASNCCKEEGKWDTTCECKNRGIITVKLHIKVLLRILCRELLKGTSGSSTKQGVCPFLQDYSIMCMDSYVSISPEMKWWRELRKNSSIVSMVLNDNISNFSI